jgi:hypothetical protein
MKGLVGKGESTFAEMGLYSVYQRLLGAWDDEVDL